MSYKLSYEACHNSKGQFDSYKTKKGDVLLVSEPVRPRGDSRWV
jgi:hypothetical protein